MRSVFRVSEGRPLIFKALADSGCPITILPGSIKDVSAPKAVNGEEVQYSIIEVLARDRTPHIIELPAIAPIELRKWGHEAYVQCEVFLAPIEIDGMNFPKVEIAFMPPDSETETPLIVLGRKLLFEHGGCCFDKKKGRIRQCLCLPRRVF